MHLVSSWLASLLAGRHAAIDPGDGSGMNLMDLASRRWSPEAVRATAPGLEQKLPALADSWSVAGPLPAPVDDINRFWSPAERAVVEQVLRYSFVGTAATITPRLRDVLDATKANELMITAHMHSQTARLRSIEIAAEVRHRLQHEASDL